MKVTQVSKRLSVCGEGPHWDQETRKLWHVDVFGKALCLLDPETQETEHIDLNGYCTLAVPNKSDPQRILVSSTMKLLSMDWTIKKSWTEAEVDGKDVRLNDGKCDALGRLWFGSMGLEGSPLYRATDAGSVYSYEADGGNMKHHFKGVGISNGLGWTSDNKTMFYIDSLARNVVAFDFDLQNGAIGKRRVVHEFGDDEGLPDGMCTDAEDKIWVACFDGTKVVRIDPHTGVQLQTITMPTDKVTSCCFGGPNYETLFVTTAYIKEELRTDKAGAVFKVEGLGVKGLPPNSFGGTQ